MELEIWTEPEPKKEPTRVRLIKGHGGRIELHAVVADGSRVDDGMVGYLTTTGWHKCFGLSPNLGFPLDEQGRIRDV